MRSERKLVSAKKRQDRQTRMVERPRSFSATLTLKHLQCLPRVPALTVGTVALVKMAKHTFRATHPKSAPHQGVMRPDERACLAAHV